MEEDKGGFRRWRVGCVSKTTRSRSSVSSADAGRERVDNQPSLEIHSSKLRFHRRTSDLLATIPTRSTCFSPSHSRAADSGTRRSASSLIALGRHPSSQVHRPLTLQERSQEALSCVVRSRRGRSPEVRCWRSPLRPTSWREGRHTEKDRSHGAVSDAVAVAAGSVGAVGGRKGRRERRATRLKVRVDEEAEEDEKAAASAAVAVDLL